MINKCTDTLVDSGSTVFFLSPSGEKWAHGDRFFASFSEIEDHNHIAIAKRAVVAFVEEF